MTNITSAPVLIAGAGPTGLILASELSRLGVRSVLVERNTSTTNFPKMDITNGTSMELLRRLGVEKTLREQGVPARYSFDVIFTSGLDGPEIARWSLPSVTEARAHLESTNDGSLPAQPWQRCSQVIFEALMMERCLQDPLIDVRRGMQLISCAQNGEQVQAVLADAGGAHTEITANYLIGCDGASSKVRTELGIAMEGMHDITRIALVHFRSTDTKSLQALGQFWHVFTTSGGTLIAQDEHDTWTLHQDLGMTDDDPIGDPRAFVAASLRHDVEIDEVLAASVWSPSVLLAEQYGSDRILLAGDAAHTMIPTGGYGMNTGLGDAFNLAWKLAAELQGWAGPKLLDSYDAERRPVGDRNRHASYENAMVHAQYRQMVNPVLVDADTDDGIEHRREIARFLSANDAENLSLGIELDVRYTDSPVVYADEAYTVPAWERRTFTPTVAAGHRAPNVVLPEGDTLFDQFGPMFTLVDASGGTEATLLHEEAQRAGLPLKTLALESEALRELYDNRLVLVRPDLHIAWSGTVVPDAASIIDRVRGAQAGPS